MFRREDTQRLATINQGEMAVLKCERAGFLIMNVILNNCAFFDGLPPEKGEVVSVKPFAVVEFTRGFGTSGSSVAVQWDGLKEVLLANGIPQSFDLTPGQHQLHFKAKMALAKDIEGSLPVQVATGKPGGVPRGVD
jgi:hypothetical protein